MSAQEITSTNKLQELAMIKEKGQYTLWQILGVWLAAGAPMWALGWLAYPVMSAGLATADAGLLRIKLLTVLHSGQSVFLLFLILGLVLGLA